MSLTDRLKGFKSSMKCPMLNTFLGISTGLATLVADVENTSAQNVSAPPVKFSTCSIDNNGVLAFTATNLVSGKYYAAGFTEDLSTKFQPAMNHLYRANTNEQTFYSGMPNFTQSGFYTLVPIEVPTTTFNFSDDKLFSGKINFQINTSTNVNIIDNQVWLYDLLNNIPYFVQDDTTNQVSLNFDTQTKINSYYVLDSWQRIEGTPVIEGMEQLWWNSGSLYMGFNNDFSADDPIRGFSNLNATPTFNFYGQPNQAYDIRLNSVDENGLTNIIAEASVSLEESAANGGRFSIKWDRVNDPNTPFYTIDITSPSNAAGAFANERSGSSSKDVMHFISGEFRIKPFNTWLHAAEKLVSWPFDAAFNRVYLYHSETAAVIDSLFLFDTAGEYSINQTKFQQSPFVLQGSDDVPRFLNYMTTTNNPPDDRWVSYLTLFAHMNENEAVGGPGSLIPEANGFSYKNLAEARGTILGDGYISCSTGAVDGAFMEGCESSGGNKNLFRAMGISRYDFFFAVPNFGQGQWAIVPALRAWTLAKRDARIIESFTSENEPTILDAITANKYYYPEGIPFIDDFGCLHKIYPKNGGISSDVNMHNFPSFNYFWDPVLHPSISPLSIQPANSTAKKSLSIILTK